MSWLWTAGECAAVAGIVAYIIKLDREGARAQREHKRRMADYAKAISEEWIVEDRQR